MLVPMALRHLRPSKQVCLVGVVLLCTCYQLAFEHGDKACRQSPSLPYEQCFSKVCSHCGVFKDSFGTVPIMLGIAGQSPTCYQIRTATCPCCCSSSCCLCFALLLLCQLHVQGPCHFCSGVPYHALEGTWRIGCDDKLIELLEDLHTNTQAAGQMGGSLVCMSLKLA